MYNTDMPTRAELPTSARLVRSTVIALITAAVLLVTMVMPADYGIDPTGIGRVLNLTQMGEIKQQLAAEAVADAAGTPVAKPAVAGTTVVAQAMAAQSANKAVPADTVTAPIQASEPKVEWRDETPFTLKPGEGTEIKLKMVEGAKAQYAWVVKGGAVNFDTHGDAPLNSISYEKGRGVASKEGVLQAAFTGNHGWYWRNRGQSDVQVILLTRGDYSELKR
jgi:hypothetical protein